MYYHLRIRSFTKVYTILGDPEVTANLYCNFAYPYWGRLRDLQYIFAVTYEPPSKTVRPSNSHRGHY